MKNIKISYFQISENIDNSIMEVSLDYPNYKDDKKCYLHELFYFDGLEDMMNNREHENIKYNVQNLDFTPFFLKIDDKIFEELKVYFENDTEYEECKWSDEVSLLNAMLGIYRKDPKSWEI